MHLPTRRHRLAGFYVTRMLGSRGTCWSPFNMQACILLGFWSARFLIGLFLSTKDPAA